MDSSTRSKSKSKSSGVRRRELFNQAPHQQQFPAPQQQQFSAPQQQQFSAPQQQQFPQPQLQQFSQPYPPQYSYPTHFSNQYPPHQQSYSQQPYSSPLNYLQHNTNSPQYAQHSSHHYAQYPTDPNCEPTPNVIESPQSPGDDNVQIVETTKKSDKVSFTKQEDIFLATAFVRVSDDPKTGRDQTLHIYWSSITSVFNDQAQEVGLPPRNTKSLKNRFARMKSDMTLYNEAVSTIGGMYFTGINEIDKMDKVKARFQQLNGRFKNVPFKFDHVVGILNQSSKFNFITTKGKLPQDKDTNSDSSNEAHRSPTMGSNDGSTQQSRQHHSGDKRPRDFVEGLSQEAISPSHPSRPMGSKAAKQAARKGKGRATTQSEELASLNALTERRMNAYESSILSKKQSEDHKMRVLQASLDLERERLALDREREQRARDIQILNMDPAQLPTDADREELAALRSSIWAKWKG